MVKTTSSAAATSSTTTTIPKRHANKKACDKIDFSNSSLKRACIKANIHFVKSKAYALLKKEVRSLLVEILEPSLMVMMNRNRCTLMDSDVRFGIKEKTGIIIPAARS